MPDSTDESDDGAAESADPHDKGILETASVAEIKDAGPPPSSAKTIAKIGLRVFISVAAVVIAVVVLANIFDDLDPQAIGDALKQLSDAEWLALIFGWIIWVGTQGAQTASLVHALPVRRGVVAYLGPSAVASVIPGPSDLPVRYSMYQTWGVSTNEAATAVAASGIFSVGSQLALPALAGLVIVITGVELEGFLTIIVATTLALAAAIALIAFVLGSEGRTRWTGAHLDSVWRKALRLLRKDVPDRNLGEIFVEQRRLSVEHIRDKWVMTTFATILTIITKCSLLVMSLRFVGIPEDDLGWSAVFAVFALVAGLTIIPITPGSAGVSEVALVGMLTPIAGSEFVNEVAAGVLLYRLLTWIMLIPAGLVALAVWRVGTRGTKAAASTV